VVAGRQPQELNLPSQPFRPAHHWPHSIHQAAIVSGGSQPNTLPNTIRPISTASPSVSAISLPPNEV
jgi:hypothetical protein